MNTVRFFTNSVAVHTIVILGLIFWPKSAKNPEIIQSMEMVQAGPSSQAVSPMEASTAAHLLDTPIQKDAQEIKYKAVLKESEEKVFLKKEKKKVERKIVKKPNLPPPLPKIKSVLKSKLNNLMENKPAPATKANWIEPNEKNGEKNGEKKNWIEPGTVNPDPNSTNTDGL